jgi:hypothetical protein
VEFYPIDHVYECIPPVLGIPDAEVPVVIGLKVVSVPDQDAEINACRGLGPEAVTKRTMDLLRAKFAYVKNLRVGGREIETFDDFYKHAPPELVGWVLRAVYSTQILSGAERKNLSPGSATG